MGRIRERNAGRNASLVPRGAVSNSVCEDGFEAQLGKNRANHEVRSVGRFPSRHNAVRVKGRNFYEPNGCQKHDRDGNGY